MHVAIGITDTESRYQNYPAWINGDDPAIEIIQLTPGNKDDLAKCSGIVLSGGIDTHPKFYNNQTINYTRAPQDFNEQRDAFELEVFRYACTNLIPVLAICRGMQLVNIALGGDLIQDIEEAGSSDHRRHGDTDGMHEVAIVKDTLLHETVNRDTGTINSAHHQAVNSVAPELLINAYSADGIAEGAEWKDKAGKPFLLCVQWHPERLAQLQPDNPLTKNIRKKFLDTIKNRHR